MPPTSLPLVPEARSAVVKVPLTDAEKRRLRVLAASQGRSVAELVRLSLPLGEQPPSGLREAFSDTQASVTGTRAA